MMNTILDSFDEQTLIDLYDEALIDKNSIGIDGVSNSKFSDCLEDEVEIIHRKTANGSYEFSLYKEKLILKGRDSKPRAISIPTNRDKLVLKVLHGYMKNAFSGEIDAESIHRKIKNIRDTVNSNYYDSFIKIDIRNFFPSIDHEILQRLLCRQISDQFALKLIEKAITQTTVALDDSNRTKYRNTIGVPQGLSISGLLASVYLSQIDKKFGGSTSFHYYRFVDDILILCNAGESKAIRKEIAEDMQEIGLQIHTFDDNEKKSSYGKIANGFQFLGYKFIGHHITVRESSLHKIYDGINRVFLQHYKYSRKRTKKRKLNYIYRRLNFKITGCVIEGKQYGWLYFFAFINDQELLYKLDLHVKRACERFKVPYDEAKIKKFSRTYYELSKMDTTNYIPGDGIEAKKKKQEFADIIADIEEDIEFY